jgi:hypothetical protein
VNNLVFISDESNADILTPRLKRTTFSGGIGSALCGSEFLNFVLFMVAKRSKESLYLVNN